MFIYHIVLPEVWERVQGRASYQAASLQTEGFIHCSYSNQLDDVIARYYSSAEKILVLKLDTEKLRSKLVEEPSTGGEIYPHLYGRLNFDAVAEVKERQPRSSLKARA
ncbi:MAG: DUF952 domain-containing protein [Pyrinomonadaceae bacterium]